MAGEKAEKNRESLIFQLRIMSELSSRVMLAQGVEYCPKAN